jgi:hypothetical protein
MRKIITGQALIVIGVALVVLGSCGIDSDDNSQPSSEDLRRNEEDSIDRTLANVQDGQPIPEIGWSQERQTLIDLLTARAQGASGTAQATSQTGELMWWCPTIGPPVPSTYQLTNGSQVLGRGGANGDGVTIDLAEPTGVYPGDSQATWVLCLDDSGDAFAVYDEQQISWASGTLDLPAERRMAPTDVTFEFATSEEETDE